MGFLDSGNTLEWDEARKYAEYVREHGIFQFLAQYRKVVERTEDFLLWGDEIEYIVAVLDSERRTVKLSLRAGELLPKLQEDEEENPESCKSAWRPEYGSFMLESTPGRPYGSTFDDILDVEPSMKFRREFLQAMLLPGELATQLTAFPMMGVGEFTHPHHPPRGPIANSYYIPDEVINPHARFGTLTRNIRLRRGSNVCILLPLFRDVHTQPIPKPVPPPRRDESLKDTMPDISVCNCGNGYQVHMDAMAFGMGCSCLQCTFQCCNVEEARSTYDQLAILSPIIMALTAASPIHRGYLVDTDVRWNVISASVDDRHREERGLDPLKEHKRKVNKSRYDSIDCFISNESKMRPEYNDLDLIYDEKSYNILRDNNIDERLAKHIAHLFIRDPLVIYSHKIELDDDIMTDHFENIQSTNWQTVRFKLPPPNSPIGWRVEFRTMELSLTDFENAAFVIFIMLLIRMINALGCTFYIPISKVDENMRKAHKRDAVNQEKFYFRKCNIDFESMGQSPPQLPVEEEYALMTMNEIINGDGKEFPGLINMIQVYLDTVNIGNSVREVIEEVRGVSGPVQPLDWATHRWLTRGITVPGNDRQASERGADDDSIVDPRVCNVPPRVQEGLRGESADRTRPGELLQRNQPRQRLRAEASGHRLPDGG